MLKTKHVVLSTNNSRESNLTISSNIENENIVPMNWGYNYADVPQIIDDNEQTLQAKISRVSMVSPTKPSPHKIEFESEVSI